MLTTTQTIARMALPVSPAENRNAGAFVEPFYAYRMRNHALDAAFYDVGALAPETIDRAHAVPLSEGGILVVHPGRNDRLEFHADPLAFERMGKGRPRTIVVAGVGSSAVGTAAFAKNVAEAVGAPVAGVVSGYGMKDLLWEALGGWFWFRTLNQVRHRMDGRTTSTGPGATRTFAWGDGLSPDTATLKTLFAADAPSFDLIVGHSKGNLSIAEALYETQSTAPARAKALLNHAHIVTISAAIYMPDGARVTDVIGAVDWFGRMNSHPDVDPDIVVEGAWHHTNTDLPAHLDVKQAVAKAIAGG